MTGSLLTRKGQRPAQHQSACAWSGKTIVYLGLTAVLLYACMLLAPIWVLLFASVLVAIFLDGAASLLRQRVFRNRLPPNQIAWVVATLMLLAVIVCSLGLLLGPRVMDQMKVLAEQLPKAVDRFGSDVREIWPTAANWMDGEGVRQLLTPSSAAGQRVVRMFSNLFGALGSAGILLAIGIYLAAQPQVYTRGCVLLVPKHRVALAEEVLRLTGRALRRWLLGRLSSMVGVFLLTSLALWILDSPLALSLGLLAGLLTFIPFIGPLLSAVPAILVGLLQSPLDAVWIALVYIIVQLIEGNLLTPLIQSYAVALKPAVLLGAQLVAGSLFGLPGVIIATPLAVALIVFVQVLYVRAKLGKSIDVMGE